MKIDPAEVGRYLGYRGHEPDARTAGLIESCSLELLASASPRSVYRFMAASVFEGKTDLEGFVIESKSLATHLKGCRRAVLFAATLGPSPDALLRRYAKTDMARMAVLQACAAAFIESYCDHEEEAIAKEAGKSGLSLLPRYSPGYGDFPLPYQKDILNILESPKKIGLGMTESYMLVPTKSVTALIGLTDKKNRYMEKGCSPEGCRHCEALDCQFRRSEEENEHT